MLTKSDDKKNNNLGGRPPIPVSKKKDNKIFVNLTKMQKKQLKILAEKEDESLSHICLKALKKAGFIT